jgi:hypothetical protein
MKLQELLNERIDISNPYHWFKKDAQHAYEDTLKHVQHEPDDFRGYFLDRLRGRIDGTLGYILKTEFGISHDPAFQTVFFNVSTKKDIDRPSGKHTLLSGGNRHMFKLDIPAAWSPDDVKDFVPYKMKQAEREAMIARYCHEIARTMAHELVHLHQSKRMKRANLKWTRKADIFMSRRGIEWDQLMSMTPEEKAEKWPDALSATTSDDRYLSKEDETWGLPNDRDEMGHPDEHYDPALLNADYLTKKVEVDAHANNAALDLLHKNNWDFGAAKTHLASILKHGTSPADDKLHSYYQHIRQNNWVDTKQAWKEYLKRVYQRMVHLAQSRPTP